MMVKPAVLPCGQLVLSAKTDEERDDWLAALTAAIDKFKQAEVKKQCEDVVRKVTEVLDNPNPDYNDPEFKRGVEILKSCRKYVAPLCGGTWLEWHANGNCQVCKVTVNRKEKGLHCSNGAHRICWKCMSKNIDWKKVITDDPYIFVTKTLGLDEVNANLADRT